jgi:hypothetical protein
MKPKHLLLAAVLAAVAAPAAQAQTVFTPSAPLDSARASVRAAVLVLRDSLQVVHAGGARMQRDFHGASAAALVSRARSLRDGCAASARTIPGTRAAIVAGPAGSAKAAPARASLLAKVDSLGAALGECERTFGAWVSQADGEAVRGYGNRGAESVRTAILAYEEALQLFLSHLGIRVQPLGAGTSLIRS